MRSAEPLERPLDGAADRSDRSRALGRPVRFSRGIPADRPRAEADFGDLKAGATENSRLHLARVRSRVLRTLRSAVRPPRFDSESFRSPILEHLVRNRD